ncbi:uncharacterized protein LOC109860774 isoform X1 [Pseudomyrmex gracilis]|uniref:uncharacterized protein LOC109860774 isoform X1 n=1 Tax=Pseudomyrmex gracilis TaxID=219809 RepID=UPI000994F7A0|nr:uncharacterized protein LOC109860774 isoform X1 [Pseudomyrmex gracilis]
MSQLYEFYDKLEYDKVDRKEILSKIKALADTAEIKDVNNTCQRYRETALVMKNNISLFHAVFGHVDVATSIIECLNKYYAKLEPCFNIGLYNGNYFVDDVISMITLFNLPSDYTYVKCFLEKMLVFPDVPVYCISLNKLEFELVLLEDSDLHAVMFYLIRMCTTDVYYSLPTKILIQEPIKDKFLYYKEKYEIEYEDCSKLRDVEIKVFRSKQELLTPKKSHFVNFVSIWSEDITTAKNLAISLNRDCVFINTYYEFFSGDEVLLPINRILGKSLEGTLATHRFKCNCNDDNTVTTQNVLDGPVSNLFYDGSWQKPVKERYWTHINDKMHGVWAQAEWNDISKCVLSASKGFKTWSTTSVESRIRILSKFAHSLECTGHVTLANIIQKWIKFPFIHESSIIHTNSETGAKIEVTKICEGKDIIIIKEETETALFDRLTQTLIAGNSVIVICDASVCNLAPYCDMLSASKMPPGVVNLLSHKNIHHLELYLCGTDYATYKKRFFSEDAKLTRTNLTMLKHILLYL